MKIILFVLMLILIPLAAANPLITGILYDPHGADGGNEWIELYNPTNETINLTNYTIERANGANENDWTLVWRGSNKNKTMLPATFYLIAENNVILADENALLKLQNGPDALRINRTNATLELIAWGTQIHTEYNKSTLAEDVSSKPLTREYAITNTITFSAEFVGLIRQPRNTNFDVTRLVSLNASREDITYLLQVPNTEPELDAVYINAPDSSSLPGHQITILNNIDLHFNITDQDGDATTAVVSIKDSTFQTTLPLLNNTAQLNLSSQILPGQYTLQFKISDGTHSSNLLELPITIMPLIGVEVNTSFLMFSKVNATKYQAQFSVTNIGNQEISLSYWLDDDFPISTVRYNQSLQTLEPTKTAYINVSAIDTHIRPGSYKGLFRVIAHATS